MKNTSVYGISKPGFTLIEIIIAIAIVAILATIVVPRLASRTVNPLDEFIEHVNRLTRLAYVRSMITGKVHRLLFRLANRESEVALEVETGRNHSGALTFSPVGQLFMPTTYQWHQELTIRNFFIKGFDENKGGTLKDAWFFVLPAGLAQDVIINIENQERHERRSLVLNPFSAKFALYDTFQLP